MLDIRKLSKMPRDTTDSQVIAKNSDVIKYFSCYISQK
jgi:hypothetical protein